jgi:hypothetical protein
LVIINARLGFSNWIQLSSYMWVQQLQLSNWINWSHKLAVRTDDSSCADWLHFFRKILLCISCFLHKHCDFCVQAWHSDVAFYILLKYLVFFKRTRNKSWKHYMQFLHNYGCSSVSYELDYGWYTRFFFGIFFY